MSEVVRSEKFSYKRGDHDADINGEIVVLCDGTIKATWFAWYDDDSNRVLQAMGRALGFPVMFVKDNHAGNGHYSGTLRHATPDEAILQEKLAKCLTLKYMRFPVYERFEEFVVDLGLAILHRETYLKENSGWDTNLLIVDTSKLDNTVFNKWSEITLTDALKAGDARKWNEAQNYSTFADICMNMSNNKYSTVLAINMIARTMRGKKSIANSEVIVFCRSYGTSFAYKLQEDLDKLSNRFGLKKLFDLKAIIRAFLERNPSRKDFEQELVSFLKE